MTVDRANALTSRWAAASDGPAVFSGAGVYPLLALLAGVASGPARDELRAVAPSALNLPPVDGVSAALGVWTRHDLPLSPGWDPGTRLSGDPSIDQPRLDAWAFAETGGRIPALPVAVDEDTGVVLASALSVVTEWVQPFDNGVMSPAAGPWSGRTLAALHRRHAASDALRPLRVLDGAVTLLTVEGGDDIDVLLAIGADAATPGSVLAAAIDGFARSTPATTGPGITAQEVDATDPAPELLVSLPAFDLAAGHDLLADPDLFGLRTASRDGTFPGISPVDLAVSSARQQAVASFTALGFQAATVTALAMYPLAYRPPTARKLRVTVTFDRPFGFLAVHRPTGLVLVAGWVRDPADWTP
ncbi:serpin family protein [Dactylosporangium siamense]|uniref:serpin family protein n=1 Tax=Dactylosporangium siamense TaxID=685454 RepID=UPI0019418213|nr:serpin family protein [Dactylosporangium siamense]